VGTPPTWARELRPEAANLVRPVDEGLGRDNTRSDSTATTQLRKTTALGHRRRASAYGSVPCRSGAALEEGALGDELRTIAREIAKNASDEAGDPFMSSRSRGGSGRVVFGAPCGGGGLTSTDFVPDFRGQMGHDHGCGGTACSLPRRPVARNRTAGARSRQRGTVGVI